MPKVRIKDPTNPHAKEVRVGYYVDNRGRFPLMWPTGYYRTGEVGDVGGTYTGYCYVYYHHEGGFVDSLKGHQIRALKELGIMVEVDDEPDCEQCGAIHAPYNHKGLNLCEPCFIGTGKKKPRRIKA